jgi:DNA-binding transcriptional regulator YdaS (Cro superfamily)
MTLSEFVHTFPRTQRMALRQLLADQLGISEVYVRSMCSGHKSIPPKYALRIEKMTNGVVPRHITAPEFYPIENDRSK